MPTFAAAQDAPQTYVYGTYFQCDPSREARADALVRMVFAPVYDRSVADKKMVAWGWLAHNLGGHWRRVLYLVAPSMDAVLDAQAGAGAEIMKTQAKARTEFLSICQTHDDYVWHGVASSRPADMAVQARPPAGYSIYYECSMARQTRADTLVMGALGAIWTRHVKPGELNSWTWYEHAVGGEYRRLLAIDGADHKSILAATNNIIAEIAKERPAEGREFNEICGSHQDYLWDIQTTKP